MSSGSSSPKSSGGTRTIAAVMGDDFTVLEIPPVTSTNKLPVRGQVTDIVVIKLLMDIVLDKAFNGHRA